VSLQSQSLRRLRHSQLLVALMNISFVEDAGRSRAVQLQFECTTTTTRPGYTTRAREDVDPRELVDTGTIESLTVGDRRKGG